VRERRPLLALARPYTKPSWKQGGFFYEEKSMSDRILRLPEVRRQIGVTTSTVYAWMSAGNFPKPLQLGPRAVGWRQSDIEAWLASRELNKTSA
jgi:prophage regulatory protein